MHSNVDFPDYVSNHDNLSSFSLHYFVFRPDLKFEFSRILSLVQKYVVYIPFSVFPGFSKVFVH